MSASSLLDRLDGVRRTGEHRWIAKCPAHDDRGPSLSIRETPDARVLLNCFAGCEVRDVLAALGATWSDLFPPRLPTDSPMRRRRENVATAADALRCLAHEARVLVLLSGDLARGETLSSQDRERLLLAASRVGKAESLCT